MSKVLHSSEWIVNDNHIVFFRHMYNVFNT